MEEEESAGWLSGAAARAPSGCRSLSAVVVPNPSSVALRGARYRRTKSSAGADERGIERETGDMEPHGVVIADVEAGEVVEAVAVGGQRGHCLRARTVLLRASRSDSVARGQPILCLRGIEPRHLADGSARFGKSSVRPRGPGTTWRASRFSFPARGLRFPTFAAPRAALSPAPSSAVGI